MVCTVGEMFETGRPAQYTRHLRRTNFANAIAAAAVCTAAGGAVLVMPGVLRWMMLALSAFAGFSCRDSWIKVKKNHAGIKAEDLAAKHLRRSGVLGLAFGAVLSRGDCDAIAVGPQLVAVEVKHGRGTLRVEKGALRDDRRALMKDPLAQVTAQAAALGKLAGAHVDAVVCVTGMTNAPFQAKNVTVCSAQDLPAVINTLPSRLSPEQARQLLQKLSQAS